MLGSDVGAIRIGYARVPVKSGSGDGTGNGDELPAAGVQGIGDLTVGATIHALRSVKGATTIPADQQVLSGAVENYRSNLLLSMIGSGNHNISDGQPRPPGWTPSVTEQQMIMRELSQGGPDAEADIQALAGGSLAYWLTSTLCLFRMSRFPTTNNVLYDYSSKYGQAKRESQVGRCKITRTEEKTRRWRCASTRNGGNSS